MKSIKNKLLKNIILINSIILIGICIFKFGFEGFYIKYKSKELNEISKNIENLLIEEDESKLNDYLHKCGENENIGIDIYDKNNFLLVTNRDNKKMNKHMDGKGIHNRYKIKYEHKISSDLNSYIMLDKSQGVEFLSVMNISKNNLYSIICKIPISSIRSSVDIASSFLFIIFIPIIIISIFMAIILANKFTTPIIKLTKVSNKISNLDFSEKLDIKTNDEIEILGNSINRLSSKIEMNMHDLKSKNIELEILINNKIKQESLRKEFVSSVSHELKTPITVINGYAHGLKSNILESEEDKNYYIDVICEESEKMGLMVNELLDLYKLESNVFKVVKDKVNIEQLIKNVVKKHEIILKEKDINIYMDIQKVYILADKIRIEQVLNNLLDNAINHIENEKIIKIYTKVIDENVYIRIYNSGSIIKEEDIKKIWHSFVRVDKVRTSSCNRIGLGLSIVREIINLHDGEYGVENKEGGVEFYIKLKKI